MKIFICVFVLLLQAGTSGAQENFDQKIDQSVQALQASFQNRDYSKLKPYLSAKFQAGRFTAQQAEQIVPQVFAQYPLLTDLQKSLPQKVKDSVFVTVTYSFKGLEKSSSRCYFDETGKITRIELLDNILKHAVSMHQNNQQADNSVRGGSPDFTSNFRLHNNLIFVTATIDGKTGYLFLDSGAPDIILNAKHFTASDTVSSGIQGMTGNSRTEGSYLIKDFVWEKMNLKNRTARLLDLSHFEQRSEMKILGLIGYSALKENILTIDYNNKTVQLTTASPQSAPTYIIPFEMKHHLPVLQLNIAGQPYSMVLDCGAGNNIVSVDLKERITAAVTWDAELSEVIGADNSSVSRFAKGKFNSVSVNNMSIDNMSFALAQTGHLNMGTGSAISGILGQPFLKQGVVSIDYPAKKLYITR